MAEDWTLQQLEHLDALTTAWLRRAWVEDDLPMLRWLLERLAALVTTQYMKLAEQKRVIETLIAVIDDQDDADAWDLGDERRW
jgi:hypothetical protein